MATAMAFKPVLNLVAAKAEQRRYPRFEIDAMYSSVSVQRTDGSGGQTALDGHAYDISLGGLRFELDEALPAGSRVAIEVGLPGCPQPIRATARVVRVFSAVDDPGPRRMAVEFETFLGASRDMLDRHIAQGWLRPARGTARPSERAPSDPMTAPIDERRDLSGDLRSIAG
jgi:c-di-GMP-binding flagellar brake protein YcgR